MALTKTRKIGSILNANNKLDVIDSDRIDTSVNKGSNVISAMSVFSSTDELPGTSVQGSMAYVTGNNRLYFYNGSGWYNIAIINNFNPQWITQPNGSYALAIDGSTTTITVLASDSDDVPIAYSAVTDSDFTTFATVAHDSDKHNVWTVTPTATTGSHSGSITFKASDGVNFVQAVSSFTLSFSVNNSYYTTALILADNSETDAQTDASTNNYSITESGNTTSTSFTPYHPGGYSVFFDGSGDYLSVSDASAFSFGTGDFTWEGWLFLRSYHATVSALIHLKNDTALATSVLVLEIGSAGQLQLSTGSALITTGSASDVSLMQWHHIAVSRSGTSLKIFLNGQQHASVTNSASYSGSVLQIGAWRFGGYDYSILGFLRDIRIVKGSAVYTSAFTIPDEPLTAIANTQLLTCHAPYIGDGSTNALTVTQNGGAQMVRYTPYDYISYNKTNHGGSSWFDGTNDGLTFGDTTTLKFLHDKTVNYTIEGWIYSLDNSTRRVIFSNNTSSSASGVLLENNSGSFRYVIYTGSSGTFTLVNGPAIQLKTWQHFAITFDGSSIRTFVNGILDTANVTTWSLSGSSSNTNYVPSIGIDQNAVIDDFSGYISDFRIVNGTTVYSSNFTVPTSPLTAITNTEFLSCNNKNNIWDSSGYRYRPRWKNGNVTASNTQRKFTSSSAIYFDGSGDFIRVDEALDNANYVTSPLTIEGWAYSNNNPSTFTSIFGMNRSSDGDNQLILGVESGQWTVHYSGNTMTSQGSFNINTWYHFAIVLNDGTSNKIEVYIDGTSIYSNTSALDAAPADCNAAFGTEFDAGSGGTPSNYFNGYMQSLRISNVARYTSNFTAPTQEFSG